MEAPIDIGNQLAKMSPQELKEYQERNCIFCHMGTGTVDSKKIYEDDDIVGVLDIHPASAGHVLLFSKKHYYIMPMVPTPILAKLFLRAKFLSNLMTRSLGVNGTTIFAANGVSAGQKAQHFLLHVIPRTEGDNLLGLNVEGEQATPEQLRGLLYKIQSPLRAQSEEIKLDSRDSKQSTASEKKTSSESRSPTDPDDFDSIANMFLQKGDEQ